MNRGPGYGGPLAGHRYRRHYPLPCAAGDEPKHRAYSSYDVRRSSGATVRTKWLASV
jgi:hypothetical protein